MTERDKPKKPIKDRDKNKDWEKDRRLRFNKTFDVLAALLPQYDPSKPFSKIEILQRSILLIEELQKEKKELLAGSNKEILKNQEELENTISMIRSRNEQLMEILRKAEIPIPEFNTKNTWVRNYKLDNKIEEKFTKIKENNLNEMNLKKTDNSERKVEFEKPKKYSKKLSGSDADKILEKSDTKKSINAGSKTVENPQTVTGVPTIITNQPPLMCLQIISNSIIVSNSSTTSDLLKTSTVNTSNCANSSSTTFSTTATPIMATGIFVPVMKLESVKILKNKKIKPKLMEIPGKLPIAQLPRKPKIEIEKKKNSEVIKCEFQPPLAKKAKKEEKVASIVAEYSSSTNKPDCCKVLTISTPELDSDIFENLQVPPSNQHPESLSPTAAYLMNFPLVSTKTTEDDIKNEPEITNPSKKVEEKEPVMVSNNQNTEILLDASFPVLFSLNPAPTINPQIITSPITQEKTNIQYKTEKNQEPRAKLPTPTQLHHEKSLAKYSSSSFTIDFVSKSQPPKPTFTFSLTSTVSSASTASAPLPSTLPIPSLTTPTFIPKSNFDFLPKPNYTVTTSSSCLNETFPSCAAKSLSIPTTTVTPSFSFSLTTLATTTNPTIYSSTKSTNFPNFSFPPTSQVSIASTNFNNNPFSIEQQITTSIGTNFTFSLTNSISSNQQMKYTSCPSYNTFNPFSTNTVPDSNGNNFVNNTSYGSSHSSTLGYDNGFNRLPTKKQTTQKSISKYNHQPVNWMMTTSAVTSSTSSPYKSQNTDYSTILPPPPPPPLDTYYPDLKRNSDIFFAHPPGDDNFPWSPNKMSNILDGSHYPNTSHSFMPSTLPNLHGDLALSTTSADQINNSNNGNQNKVQNNFFSVSQLVDNQPSNINNPSIKLSNKPLSSAIKSNSSVQSIVKPAIKKQGQNNYNTKQTSWNYSTESMLYDNNNLMPPPSIPPPPLSLVPSSSLSTVATTLKQSSCNIYSAESLIASSTNLNQTGNISQKKEITKYNRSFNDNYNPIIPPPSTDSYFSMDYLNSNVANTGDLNNTTTNYNNFLYNNNSNNNNYPGDSNYYPNAIENYNTNVNIKNSSAVVNTSTSYKQYPTIKHPPPRNIYHNNINQTNVKHSSSNMNRNISNSCSLPNYDTLPNSTYFQPAMGINSPLDESSFHLYPSSSSYHHHHHQLPSSNLNNNGHPGGGTTSLANFNLSTICPEINDKVSWG